MNNIKEINQIPKQVFDTFKKADHTFLVKMIQKDNNGNYKNVSVHVPSIEEAYRHISHDQIIWHEIFNIGESIGEAMGVTKMKAKEFMAMEAKQKRLAQYNELKKEFETLPLPEQIIN